MCFQLADLCGTSDPSRSESLASELIFFFRRALRGINGDRVVIILIDEIPAGPDFADFLKLALQLSLAIAADEVTCGRVLLAFSSIHDPCLNISTGMPKIRERIQFLALSPWQQQETLALVDLLAPIIPSELEPADRESIARAANGSPRYVKGVFRHWRNGTAGNLTLAQLLDKVAAEQV
jgi:hypothetical protein